MGQSDVGPPATIGFNCVAAPLKDLFEVKATNAYFVGLTSPSAAVDKVVEGLTELRSRISDMTVDLWVINTDGWVEGKEAAEYKIRLAESASPSIVVGIQQGDELAPILTALKERRILTIDSPKMGRRRNREKRRTLRELSYKKYLKHAKVQPFAMNFVRIEGASLGRGSPPTAEQMERIRSVLGTLPAYCEETLKTIFVVLRKNQSVDE